MSDTRYALYYAPRPEEPFAVAATQWLGWNPDGGRGRPMPASSGIDPQRLSEIIAEPRRYGFHGTLKPPMRLIDEVSEADFLAAVGRFAATERAFTAAPLMLRRSPISWHWYRSIARPSCRIWPTAASWSSRSIADRPARKSWRADA